MSEKADCNRCARCGKPLASLVMLCLKCEYGEIREYDEPQERDLVTILKLSKQRAWARSNLPLNRRPKSET